MQKRNQLEREQGWHQQTWEAANLADEVLAHIVGDIFAEGLGTRFNIEAPVAAGRRSRLEIDEETIGLMVKKGLLPPGALEFLIQTKEIHRQVGMRSELRFKENMNHYAATVADALNPERLREVSRLEIRLIYAFSISDLNEFIRVIRSYS